MSGIFAYFAPPVSRPDLVMAAMAERLTVTPFIKTSHSGPQSAGVGTASLDHFAWERRPIHSANGRLTLWMIGEFFNYKDRLTQVERERGIELNGDLARFALEVYQAEGVEGLTALSGTFQLAIWDEQVGQFLLVNDRTGFYPHYFYHRGQTFVLAPSLQSILAAPDVAAVPDETAVAQFLRFQQILGGRSWIRNVSLIPPATILRFQRSEGALTARRYWDWDQISQRENVPADEALDECCRLFRAAVENRTGAVRTALLLSGGLDSRAILAFVPDPARVATFTYGSPKSLDVQLAARIARTAGSPHECEPLYDGAWVQSGSDQFLGLIDAAQSVIHSHWMTSLPRIRRTADIVLTGWGGGTILGGYVDSYERDAQYRALTNEGDLARAMYEAFCRHLTWPGLTDEEEFRLTTSTNGQALRGVAFETLCQEFNKTRHYDPGVRLDAFYIDQHERRKTLYMHVVARGFVEARAPFKDDDLVSYFLSLPEHVRRSPWLVRAILHRQAPALARIPYEKDGLPPHPSERVRTMYRVVRRARRLWRDVLRQPPPTHLYADYEEYLRTDLRPWMEELLFSRRSLAHTWFDPTAVRKLWNRHLSGREPWTIGKIMPIVTIEQVMRRFFDGATEANIGPAKLERIPDKVAGDEACG
jgi:asparagine synthase (glutamine-hydrolysing)